MCENIKITMPQKEYYLFEKIEITITNSSKGDKILHVEYTTISEKGKQFYGKGFVYTQKQGESCWKIRYSSSEEGKFKLTVKVETTHETFTYEDEIRIKASKGKGFIKIDEQNRYYKFDDETSFFAIGMNAIANQSSFDSVEDTIYRLSNNGANYIRLWLSSNIMSLFDHDSGEVNLENAKGYDSIIELSEKKGIYIKFCFEHMKNFVDVKNPSWGDYESTFSYIKGGQCYSEYDFFTKKEVRESYCKKVIDYIIARWGYSTNIFAWELWNEIENVKGVSNNKGYDFESSLWKAIIEWSSDVAEYIKKSDDNRHLVTNSLGSYLVRKEMWDVSGFDFVQVHGYWKPDNFTCDYAKDISIFVEEGLTVLKSFNKPKLFAEYGLVDSVWGKPWLSYADRDALVIRDGAWSSLMCGAAGTAMFWWGNVVMEMSQEWAYRGISSFVKDIDFISESFTNINAQCNRQPIKVRGLKGKYTTILWLKNRNSTWWSKINNVVLDGTQDNILEVFDQEEGEYSVEIWDTAKGVIDNNVSAESKNGRVIITIDFISNDCAIKIKKINNK